MPRRLQHAVVVITGASSGIGRATALEFAARGAHVVAAARREDPLESVVRECESAGAASATSIVCDTTDEEQVQALASDIVTRFGRIDVWVNNAAVTSFGLFEDTPLEVWKRVVETNLFGYVHGARAALPYFRLQRSGALINVGSMVSRLSEPYASAYVASKHAVRGLSMSLRQELFIEGYSDISVSLVMPATIDTPFFQHAADFAGRAVKAMPPVYPAERVARAIVHLAVRPRRERWVGNSARQLAMLSAFAPGFAERLLARMTDRQHLYKDQNQPPKVGNLFNPDPDGREVSGGWKVRGTARTARALVSGALLAVPAFFGWRVVRPRLTAAAS